MKYIAIGLSVVALLIVGGGWWMISSVNRTVTVSAPVTLHITKGEGIRSVANDLFNQKLISSRQALVLYAIFTGRYHGLLPGDYNVSDKTTGRELLEMLMTGPTETREVKVTIREGMRLADIATLLEQKNVVGVNDFLNITKHPADAMADLLPNLSSLFSSKSPSVDMEGYLFPDTYLFFRNSPAIDVVNKILTNTDTRLSPAIRQKITSSGHSLHEILTMASILQAELQKPADMAMAADLFWRRVAQGMGLNADTTVLYALGRSTGSLTNADLKIDSPYNTYKYKGLPPGPINNPGLDAINAALNPTPNEYLYYLTAPSGETIWAKTYDQHVANKRQYLQ